MSVKFKTIMWIAYLQVVVTYASTYVLVALSIDRYDAITHPMNFTGSWRRARGLVIVAWVLSFLFSTPILHFYDIKEMDDYGTQCWIEFDEPWQWRLYMTLVSVSLFVIPAILIGGCYIIIVVTIWSKGKEMAPAHVSGGISGVSSSMLQANRCASTASTASEVLIKKRRRKRRKNEDGSSQAMHEEVETRRASSRGLIPKAKVKTVKMTFVIIFVFILCWSPYIVFDLLQVYGCITDNSTNRAVATFIQSLAPLNSAANPLIYCLFSTNAGSNVLAFFGCCKPNGGGLLRNGRGGARGKSGGGGGNDTLGGSGGGILGGAATSSTSNTKSTTIDSSASSSSSIIVSGGRRRAAVGKNNSVVSWAADSSVDETRGALLQSQGSRRTMVAAEGRNRNSIVFNDF
jgi:hypothetical protein